MRPMKSIAALAIIAVPVLAAPSGAEAAKAKPRLSVKSITAPPQSVAAGGRFTVTATLRNTGRKTGKGRLRFNLVRGPKPFQVGLVDNVRVRAKAVTKVRIRLTVPGNAPAGGYRLRGCIRQNGTAVSRCYRTRAFVVTAAPTPEPSATPTASPTATPTATATPAPPIADQVRSAVTVDNMLNHLRALQDIATANDGNRAAGTPGNEASIAYVKSQLEAAGYTTQVQPFAFTRFIENAPSLLQVQGADEEVDSATAEGSPSGDVTAKLQVATPNFTPPRATGTDGCEAEDFAGKDFTGRIALIQRGTCTLAQKVANADEAGAVAVVFFNAGDDDTDERNGIPNVTAGEDVPIPVVNIAYADGEALYDGGTLPTVHLKTDTKFEETSTANVIAETPGGNPDRTVVVGSHLDSVPEGPGINDDGSGSAFNLELAIQMAKLPAPKNRTRFIFFGAEEAGLLGSYHYVEQLSLEDAQKISAMLDFDMLASPNFGRLVYDGDGSTFGEENSGPAGAGDIEKAFNDEFASHGLATEPIPFDGRSDYDGFASVGIPAGGIFAGAEAIKSQEEVDLFGGIPDLEFDPNYHESGDTIRNINRQGYLEHKNAAAYVSAQYAFERDLAAPQIVTGRAARRSNDAGGRTHLGGLTIR